MKRILIIDDDDDIRAMLRIVLSRGGGAEVKEAASGIEGVRLAETTKPDLVLLDWMMPGCDGPGTLALLREKEETRFLRVVFLTAASEEFGDRVEKDPFVIGVIRKPFDPLTIVKELRALFDASICAKGSASEEAETVSSDGGRRDGADE